MTFDVAIVGGGPAGLAAAIEVARRGLSAGVFERREGPVDKACGEGLMPQGLHALSQWQVRLPPEHTGRFTAIRYVQEDGRYVEAALPEPGGLGVRRLALHQAMWERARAAGVEMHSGCRVLSHRQQPDGVELETSAGAVRARLVVAADGLHSPLRKSTGLEVEKRRGPRRFGLRQHFALAPWGERVEVHFAEGAEAYVTPAGARRVGIAFLWQDGAVPGRVSFESLLQRFPSLAERVRAAPADSAPMGAGPLRQEVRRLVQGRLLLLGDAAGYVDAITGEGLSLAFEQARLFGAVAPQALGEPDALQRYQRGAQRAFRSYARLAGALVALAQRPALRRGLINRLIEHPGVFAFALRHLTRPPNELGGATRLSAGAG